MQSLREKLDLIVFGMFFFQLICLFLFTEPFTRTGKTPVPIKRGVKNKPDSLIPAREVTFSDVIAAATQTWEAAVMIWIRAPAPSHLFTTRPASMCRYEDNPASPRFSPGGRE